MLIYIANEHYIDERRINKLIDSIFSLIGKSLEQINEIEKETEKEI